MTVTQGEAVRAYTTLTAIDGRDKSDGRRVDNGTAYKLFRLKKVLLPVVEFQSEQEVKLAAELGGCFSEAGRLNLPDDKKDEYTRRHSEMEKTECEVEYERRTIKLSDLPALTIRDMENLDLFIEWGE